MNHNRNSGGFPWGTLIGGIAVGFGISLLLSPEQREKAKEKLQDGAEELKKLMTDPAERDRVMDIFGDVTAESRQKYANVRDLMISSMQNMKNGWRAIDKQKYLYLVTDVLDDLKNEQKLTVRQLNKLRKYLEMDYQKIQAGIPEVEVSDGEEV